MIWLTCSFNFYLIQFLINTFDQIYLTALGSSASDLLGYSTGGLFRNYLGIKPTFISGFSLAVVGGLVIIFYGLDHQGSWSFPVLILFAKFGVAMAFNCAYTSHTQIFPILFAASAMGYCNTIARLFSAGSPIFAYLT